MPGGKRGSGEKMELGYNYVTYNHNHHKTLFFLNGDLHRKLSVDKPRDQMVTWNYPKQKRIAYVYTDVIKRKEPAFSQRELVFMLNRSRWLVWTLIKEGQLPIPQYTYPIDKPMPTFEEARTMNGNAIRYFWTEDMILSALEALGERNDAKKLDGGHVIQPETLPTPREVKAKIHQEDILYVKKDGVFIPTWRANPME